MPRGLLLPNISKTRHLSNWWKSPDDFGEGDLKIFGGKKGGEVAGFEEEKAEEFEGVFEGKIGSFKKNFHSKQIISLLIIPKFGIFFGIGFNIFGIIIFLFDILPY